MQDGATLTLTECLQCGGSTSADFRELRYEFGDVTVVVQDVPVIVCEDCGEVLVAGALGVALGDVVEQVAEAARLLAQASRQPDEPLETVLRLPRIERNELMATA